MGKQTLLQLLLFSVVLFLTFLVYKYYFMSATNTSANNEEFNEEILVENNNENNAGYNLIKDLNYTSKDSLGNQYTIKSEFGELDLDNPDFILMKNVEAIIIMKDSEPINIFSKYAKYNNKDYQTNFYENVLIIYLDNKIKSENFDISVMNNYANVHGNIIFENSEAKMKADRIEIDLITKNSKIFMIDKNKKVKIINN